MAAHELLSRFWSESIKARNYQEQMMKQVEARWQEESIPQTIQTILDHNRKLNRVGYVVATCSPVTRAHIELAQQSVKDLALDMLFFILWPFHYIPGFHKRPLDSWVREQKHLPWEDRFFLVTQGVLDVNDQRIEALSESKQWYQESDKNYAMEEPCSAFWTGTWYVIQKLQWQIKHKINPNVKFVFVCGVDQFNPNIDALISSQGDVQVWQDYSIAQHLALHDIYVVPRNLEGVESLEQFCSPFGCNHAVFIGDSLKHAYISATQIRFHKLRFDDLDGYVTPRVATHIKTMGWWGY